MLNHRLLTYSGTGRIRNTSATPTDFNGGTPMKLVGGVRLLCMSDTASAVITHGAPYTAAGILCGTATGAVVSFSQGGLPYAAGSTELAIDTAGAIVFYNAGLPYTAAGKLAMEVAE